MSPEVLDELARKVSGRLNLTRDACSFPCGACGKSALAKWPDGRLSFEYFCGCPHDDSLRAAFSAALNPPASQAIDSDDDFDPPTVEPAIAGHHSHNGGHAGSNSHAIADEVRAAIRSNPQRAFEDVLGAALTHKPGSREPVARCPLHDDSRPSLRVNLDKATWYCDPCAKGGDLFNLAREVWGLDFPACARRLAEMLNINGYCNGNRASQQPSRKPAASRKVVRRLEYVIRDLDGTQRAIHRRLEYDDGEKDMPWDPVGIKPAELPLFQIEKTTDSMDGETVVLCEGEKAAAALWERRQLAVGTVIGGDKTGSKVHGDESLKPLLRFDVVLWPDNDEPGRRHMQAHGDALIRLGCKSVRRIEWREAPPKGDAADFLGDDAALQALIDAAGAPQMLPAVRDKSGTDLAIVYADRMSVDAFDAYQLMVGDHREYSWDGLIRDGCTAILSALIGAGKSTLAMNLARGWGLGVEFLGRKCRLSKTLVVVSPKEYEAWTETIGFWQLKGLIFIVESTKAHFGQREETVRWFDYQMREHGCRTFVLDTLFDFFGMPPNSTGDSNRIAMNEQTPLLELVREQNYSGLVTGHAPKSEAKAIDPRDPEEAFAGHTAWTAQHRMRMTIRRKSQGINAFVTGRGGYSDRGILKEELLLFDKDTRLDSLGGLFSEHLGKAAMPSVIECLEQLGQPASISQLEKEMGRGHKWIRPGLREGRREGRVEMVGTGNQQKYRLVTGGLFES
jgi:hypothetical protein